MLLQQLRSCHWGSKLLDEFVKRLRCSSPQSYLRMFSVVTILNPHVSKIAMRPWSDCETTMYEVSGVRGPWFKSHNSELQSNIC